MALPALVAGVGPFGKRSGGWTVDPTRLTSGERVAAASLYLALVTDSCLRLAGVGRFVAVEGPLARNALYCGALAALTGARVIPSPDATGTTVGAAMLFGGDAPAAAESQPVAPLDGGDFLAYCAAWRAASA